MKKMFDQIIVGGGVIGCSIAYQLSKRGHCVLVLESEKMGGEASSAAAGMLGAQAEFTEDGALFQFARQSRRLFEELSEELLEETDIDINYVHKGMLKLAFDEQQNQRMDEIAAFQKRMGRPAYILSGKEAGNIEKCVARNVAKGLYLPEDGQVSAPNLNRAFLKAAQNKGTVIQENEKVTRVMVKAGEVCGVETTHHHYYADQVIAATGAFSNGLFPSLPSIIPIKGECLELKLDAPVIQTSISTEGCYIVPKQGGKLVVGATSLPGRDDKEVSVEAVLNLLDKACCMIPGLTEAKINRFWSGIRPGTHDGKPFLGAVPGTEGLYAAMGHYRNGILLSPLTGVYMADLLEGKNVDPLFYKSFKVGRLMRSAERGCR